MMKRRVKQLKYIKLIGAVAAAVVFGLLASEYCEEQEQESEVDVNAV